MSPALVQRCALHAERRTDQASRQVKFADGRIQTAEYMVKGMTVRLASGVDASAMWWCYGGR